MNPVVRALSAAVVAAVVIAVPAAADAPPEPTVAFAATPSGLGYLIVTDGGIVFSYGDAPDHGGLESIAPLAAQIVGGAITPSGNGYWLWAADGGVFAFGDAGFFGSMGAVQLAQPISGGASTPSGAGYWLWAADGGVFAFGDAPFLGSLGAVNLNEPIIAGGPTATGFGYLFIGADGGSFAFGDAAFPGSSAERGVTFEAGAATPGGDGLWLITRDGYLEVLGSAPRLGAPQVGPPPSAPPPLDQVELVITTLATDFDEPVDIVSRPGDATAIYVAERAGRVLRVDLADPGSRSTVLDITSLTSTSGERGLLGIVFNGDGSRLYLDHTNLAGNLRMVEYAMTDFSADVSTRRELISIDQPFANHNGGDITIGPDGYVYLASGDGGSGGDPQNNGQNIGNLLGTIVRIDPTPSGGLPYTVPPDNPFVGVSGARPEIWAYGLRNPWRFAFDSATGDLWIADVGQNEWEEIDVIPAGSGGLNFGWRIREGAHPFNGSDPGGLIDPVYEYDHDNGCSITGGVIVADPRLVGLVGDYLFSDFCASDLRALRLNGHTVTSSASIAQLPFGPVTFGEGPAREIYVAMLGGTIVRLDPVPG